MAAFQLPPSHEGEHEFSIVRFSVYSFQLPPSHEGELSFNSSVAAAVGFQLPPSHEGERESVRIAHPQLWDFNSRPRMRANTIRHGKNLLGAFQLPPSHEGERREVLPDHGGHDFNSRPRMRANGQRVARGFNRVCISTPALA